MIKTADTTGAGDAFHCAFVASVIMGLPVEKAMDNATANAHSEIMHLGTKNNLLSWHGMEHFLREHETAKTRTIKQKI